MTGILLSRRTMLGAAASALLPASRGQAGEPTRLIGVIEEDPPFFNPAVSSGISSFVAGAPCHSALTRLGRTGQITGDLARDWDISADGMVYTFRMRPNILWHDGQPFSSADVKFSLEQINSKLHPYHGAMNAIAS
jgi:peptide/nickel transport system substrate-binding protein